MEMTQKFLVTNPRVYKEQWTVKGDSGTEYTVSRTQKEQWQCSCKGWICHTPRTDCKHITYVKESLHLRKLPGGDRLKRIPVIPDITEWEKDENHPGCRQWTVRTPEPTAIVRLFPTDNKLVCNVCELNLPCQHAVKIVRLLQQEAKSAIHAAQVKRKAESIQWDLDNYGLPICNRGQCSERPMEAGWGYFRCPTCGLVISEDQYYEELHKRKTPEMKYPV